MTSLPFREFTETVLAQMASTPSPRLRKLMANAVRHLHAFAQEVELTPDEWLKTIGFLTAAGKMCSADRQEFVLLSDVLGLSTLVNRMSDKSGTSDPTKGSLLGPFYREHAPHYPLGASISNRPEGLEIQLYGRVTDTDGQPVPGAYLQVWQANAEGYYDFQLPELSGMDMRGCFECDEDGYYFLRSRLPSSYPLPHDGPVRKLLDAQDRHGMRPAHIHYLISANGHQELVTALYLAGDRYLASDAVFGVLPSLVVTLNEKDPEAPVPGIPTLRYDFVLTREAFDTGRVGSDPAALPA